MFRKFVLLLFIAGLSAPVSSQDRTATEFDDLSHRRLDTAATRDLTRMIEVRGEASRPGGGIQTVSFRTAVVGSDLHGVCQRDLLFMNYDTVESATFPRSLNSAIPADARLRPFSLQTVRQFFFKEAPTPQSLHEGRRRESRGAEDCSEAEESNRAGWIRSDRAYVAAFGLVNILPNARLAAQQGLVEPIARQGCQQQNCNAVLANAVEEFSSIRASEMCGNQGYDRCYRFETDSDRITAWYHSQADEYGPEDIRSIEIVCCLNIIVT